MRAFRLHRLMTFHAALILLCFSPTYARGADDGGARSVFAFGAGNRALALGGAYVAVANDASAAIWNPAGLGRLERRMLELSHTSMYGMGFSEQYMSFVIPSWRFGTAGLTLRHFGVDGIDVRDARNFLLGDNESDNQTEIGLSYGRAMGSAWNVGGTLKIQRQSTLGFSGTGFGVDLGMIVHPGHAFGSRAAWANQLTVGLAVRNILEPSIRLSEESVSDPTAARVGLGYWIPFGIGRAVQVAVDVEKTKSMNTRAHAGLEARLHPMFSVRTGVNSGMFTAGTGFSWRDVSFDYVFENNEIRSVHRFGASMGFGMTIHEARQAALDAEAALLEARLAEALQKRQSQRVDELLRLTATALENKRYKEALDLLGTVKVLEPTNGQADALEAHALLEMATQLESKGQYADAALTYGRVLALVPRHGEAASGQARCRAESDRRAARSAQIRRQFRSALESFAREEFVEAREGFQQILSISPNDAEANTMLQRTKDAIRSRSANSISLANRLLASGSHEEAAALAQQASTLDPGTPGLDQVRARIQKARVAQARARAAEAAARAEDTAPVQSDAEISAPVAAEQSQQVDPQREREFEDLYKRGVAAMQGGRADEAIRYWELVWSGDPSFQRVNEHLTNEYLMRGMEAFAQGQLTDAIRYWENALRVEPSNAKALGYLSRAQEQLDRTREILGGGE